MGSFRLEMSNDGVVAVTIRVPGHVHQVAIQPQESEADGMARLEKEFGEALGYELSDGERLLIFDAIKLIAQARTAAQNSKALKDRLAKESAAATAAKKAEFDAAVAKGVQDALASIQPAAPAPAEPV